MSQKKEDKKDVKVQDLAPKKDAKGGAGRSPDASMNRPGGGGLNAGNKSMNAGGQNLDRGGSSGAN
ncbi:MAG: hypothetical protein ACR2NX_06880 [Chthoniobacterales bacterium]